jgi:ATP-dependent Clp protease ATP-binding subunit ClpA
MRICFKPALARGEIQCIGATTLDDRQYRKDGALERRFQKIIGTNISIRNNYHFE